MSTEEALKIDSEQVEEEETTTKYGEGNYWDTRYGEWAQDPYDWLFGNGTICAPPCLPLYWQNGLTWRHLLRRS